MKRPSFSLLRRTLPGLLFIAAGLILFTGARDEPAPDAKALVGRWKVDLRPKPGAADYYKTFEVKSVDGKTFEGTFYDADLRDGRLNTDRGSVRFAFATEDQSGVYHHSGTLRDGKLHGLTHSIGRKFLSVWTAERET